ncbi:hypothetical protein Taro_002517, partial [Colocasia esculenta]|nr:hypothetical protein [Colocasia esculenta]
CLEAPLPAQYSGGIIPNPDFDEGLKGWTAFASGEIEERTSSGGNKFAATVRRREPYHSFSHKLRLEEGKLYTLSAWLQVKEGEAPITAVFKTDSGYTHAGVVWAKSGCWSMLKGGITANRTGPAELYFETKNTTLEMWVDGVSLQPFSEEEWRTHQEESIEKVRKRTVAFTVRDAHGRPIPGATVTIKQARGGFPFGCAITSYILSNEAYQSWFASRFTVTVFENELKWYSTERIRGNEDYSVADAMLAFAGQRGIAVRGHNILWDDPHYQPAWVPSLPTPELQFAVSHRVNSVVSRYRGRLIDWDVVNENLHWSFFESRLGPGASASAYQRTQQIDPGATLFLNEYNTLEEPGDPASTPSKYLQKVREMSGIRRLAIGLQGHFHTPNIPYMRAAIDTLAGTGLPIWLTEVDVTEVPNQAHFLEQVLREAHAHPAVGGIVLWSGWRPFGCNTCLTDNEFRNLPTGDVVDALIREWGTHQLVGTADDRGVFEARLFHGDYEVTVSHPASNATAPAQNLTVAPLLEPDVPVQVYLVA